MNYPDRDQRAKALRWLHGSLALIWFAMIPVTNLTALKGSLPFLTSISVYALAVGHAASWQSSRAEREVRNTVVG